MNTQSRSRNSTRNVIYGFIGHFVTLILQFVGRTIFINLLGTEYLGVNGLYGNILNVLSLAELGIDNVMLFSLYKPIAENDRQKITALLAYYKKLYIKIAFAVLGLGLAIVPFLRFIVTSRLETVPLILYYILFLLNSVASYFSVYRSALIKADQNAYIINNYTTMFVVVRYILQILFLVITKSFAVYLIIQLLCTFLTNFALSKKAEKLYPFIKEKHNIKSTNEKVIFSDIKYAFVYRVANILTGNTDNILISVIVGTVYVGYYSNYSMFVYNISVVINMLVIAVFSSFGNLYASGEKQKLHRLFNSTVLFFQWLATACSLCFYTIFNDFITLWIGEEYTFSNAVVFVIVLNFYTEIIFKPLWLYRETMGLFKEVRYIRLCTAGINLILSVVFGYLFGIFGILIATFIATVITFAWYEPLVIYKKLDANVKEYFLRQLKYVVLAVISFGICIFICSFLGHGIVSIILKLAISVITATAVFIMATFKSEDFKTLYLYFKNILVKK